MQKLLLFALALFMIILVACSPKKDETQVDNWETPTLNFKSKTKTTSESVHVTSKFQDRLAPDDQFEFVFKGSPEINAEKQKSIVNVRVDSRCGANIELNGDVYLEHFDLGSGAIISAQELTPPGSLLENEKTLFCAWTLTIFNRFGSSHRYPLQTMILNNESTYKIKIISADQKELAMGSVIEPNTLKGMQFTLPTGGIKSSRLVCDLVTLTSQTSGNSLYELVSSPSSNEKERIGHPLQRCFVEVAALDGHISRSGGYTFYLATEFFSGIEIAWGPPGFGLELPRNGREVIGIIKLKNLTDQKKTFSVGDNWKVRWDVLFFDDREPMWFNGNTPVFWAQEKKGNLHSKTELKIQNVEDEKLIVLAPREEISFELLLDYETDRCPGVGQVSVGGFRVPISEALIAESAPYMDSRSKVVKLKTSSDVQVKRSTPLNYFIRFGHNKLWRDLEFRRKFVSAYVTDC